MKLVPEPRHLRSFMSPDQLNHSPLPASPRRASPRRRPFLSPFRRLALLACLLLAACANPDTFLLRQGFQFYSAQQVDQAEAAADRFIADHPNAPEIDQAYYLRGISRLTQGHSAAAAADLRLAIQKTSRPDLRSKAYRALGDLAYDQDQWPDALRDFQAALNNPTLDPTTANYLNYRIGAVLQAQGDWPQAEPWFAKVIAARRDPALTDRALRRLHARAFALQYGAFQDPQSAQALAAQLRDGGIPANVVTEARTDPRSDPTVWYLVQSGSYPTYAAATAARNQILPQIPVTVIVP
jgi:tetratricopeptide (TPR) repeat protein